MAIQVKELTHIYSEGLPYELRALDSISFDVADGEFMGIIGHTGSGKSTLIQHLNGLLKPKTGNIIINEVDITEPNIAMREIRRKVGLVFQYPEYQLFEETVYKDIAFGPQNLGLSSEEIDVRIREALSLVGLDFDEMSQRSPFELSGGQKRRVAIAGVIAMKPEVLILDEPTAGLDPQTHKDILHMIKEIHKTTGNIVILVSHNMTDIAENCDKVLVLEKGKTLLYGTPKEVFLQKAKLELSGLDIPPVMDFMHMLKKRGLDLKEVIFNVDEAAEEIVRALKYGSEVPS